MTELTHQRLELARGRRGRPALAELTFRLGPVQLTSEDHKVILLVILTLALPAMG